MKSHQTEFSWTDVRQVVALPLLAAAGCALLVHLAAWAGALPAPRPTLDTDRTILIHQVDAARTSAGADVVLIGDSSCLMDVSGLQLAGALGQSVLNFGTLSYLDPAAYGLLLQEHTRRHAPRVVVLLMHPEALRRLGSESHQRDILASYLASRDDSREAGATDVFNHYAGVDLVQGRLLARWVPSPLGGAYGAYYGFAPDLEKFMTYNFGSAVDPGSEKFSGRPEYRLAPTLDRSSQAFRALVPRGTKLLVGMTPAPNVMVGPDFPAQRDAMLRQWADWLSPAHALTNLPASLPDDQFARSTHLKPSAVPAYTRQLATAIRPHLP